MAIFDALEFEVGLDLSGVKRGLKQTEQLATKAGGGMAAAFGAVAAAAATVGAAFTAIGVGAVQTGAQFETFSAQFETVLGSATAAQSRMADLFDFASSTPFNLDEVVEADLILERFGQNAQSLRVPVMDLAAALDISLQDAASQVGRAMTSGAGSADLLRERGVLAAIELREAMKATEMGADQFRQALIGAMTDPDGQIAGGTKRLAATFRGLTSNLADEWTRFTKEVADAGIFDASKEALKATLGLLDQNREAVNGMAQTVGGVLTTALEGVVFVAGGLVDAWTLIKGGALGYAAVITEGRVALEEAGLAAVDYARALERIPVIGDQIGAGLDGLAQSFQVALTDDRRLLAEMEREAGEIADNFGRGAAFALEFSANVDAARRATAALASSAPPAPPEDPEGPATVADSTESAKAALDDVAGAAVAAETKVADATVNMLSFVATNAQNLTTAMTDFTTLAVDQSLMAVADTQAALQRLGDDATREERQRLLQQLEDQKEQGRKQFGLAKSLQIATAIISGGAAALAALQTPPIGYGNNPFGWIMFGTTLATTAGQVASIAAQQAPFHQGGIIGERVGSDPSERRIIARQGEAVLTAQGAATAGGSAGVAALNRGDAGGGRGQTIVWQVGNRVLSAAYLEAASAPGPVRASTRPSRPRGRRNVYLAVA